MRTHVEPRPALCVLASGSGGNCTVLLLPGPGGRRTALLIDLGLSPRRTRAMLDEVGVAPDEVVGAVLTHLDSDHFNAGWAGAAARAPLWMHDRHLARAERAGGLFGPTFPFAGEFEPAPGVRVRPVLLAHDDLGVASFRVEFEGGETLGFATDVGTVTPRLVEHLRGVDVLAIESNYCPRLQIESSRPEALKRRIMGGSGHLSNDQCRQAVEAIGPREHVVFLHLSRECNRADLVHAMHAGADYALTIAEQDRPTRWVRVGSAAPSARGAAASP